MTIYERLCEARDSMENYIDEHEVYYLSELTRSARDVRVSYDNLIDWYNALNELIDDGQATPKNKSKRDLMPSSESESPSQMS